MCKQKTEKTERRADLSGTGAPARQREKRLLGFGFAMLGRLHLLGVLLHLLISADRLLLGLCILCSGGSGFFSLFSAAFSAGAAFSAFGSVLASAGAAFSAFASALVSAGTALGSGLAMAAARSAFALFAL